MAEEFSHKALAKTHDLSVGFALGVKIATAFTAAHREGGEAVFEDLLKAEELQNGKVDAGVETQAALVGADSAVELDAESAVHMHFAFVVHPGDAKHDDALWFHDTLENIGFHKAGIALIGIPNGLDNFLDGLQKLRFTWVSGGYFGHEFLKGHGNPPCVFLLFISHVL